MYQPWSQADSKHWVPVRLKGKARATANHHQEGVVTGLLAFGETTSYPDVDVDFDDAGADYGVDVAVVVVVVVHNLLMTAAFQACHHRCCQVEMVASTEKRSNVDSVNKGEKKVVNKK